jgi:CRP/FNR family transcriptional regulator
LDEYPFIQKGFLNLLAERIYTKSKTTKDIVNQKPEFRIIAFLNAHKNSECSKKELVPYTRQEIANFTGLRVETVIRELSRLSKTDKVEIINHKLYY